MASAHKMHKNSHALVCLEIVESNESYIVECIDLPAKIRRAFSTVNEKISEIQTTSAFNPKPPGIPHHAAALPVPEPSLHLAIALHRRPMALSSVLGAMLTLQRLVAWPHWCNGELDVDVGHKECSTRTCIILILHVCIHKD